MDTTHLLFFVLKNTFVCFGFLFFFLLLYSYLFNDKLLSLGPISLLIILNSVSQRFKVILSSNCSNCSLFHSLLLFNMSRYICKERSKRCNTRGSSWSRSSQYSSYGVLWWEQQDAYRPTMTHTHSIKWTRNENLSLWKKLEWEGEVFYNTQLSAIEMALTEYKPWYKRKRVAPQMMHNWQYVGIRK